MEKTLLPMLAVDFGERHFGLAVSDSAGQHAMVLPEITTTPALAVAEVIKIAESYRSRSILVGLPVPQSGNSGITDRVKHFIQKLRNRTKLPIFTFDELLSSKLAGSGKNSHSEAARIILQGYLDTINTENA